MSARRPLIRLLRIDADGVACPRRRQADPGLCETCPFGCAGEEIPGSVACSYPIPAAETFAARRRTNERVRLALEQVLERT